MNHPQHIDDTRLNAFIDGALGDEDAEQVMAALQSDAQLGKRLCQLSLVREMVRQSYREPPKPASKPPRGRLRHRAAAAVLIVTGVCAGWFGNEALTWRQPDTLIDLARLIHVPNAGRDSVKVMLHVSTNDEGKMKTVLDETEKLLGYYERELKQINVEVLTNGAGLNMLRADASPFAARIRDLQQRYENVRFVACKIALDKLQKELGRDVPLLPGSDLTPSSLDEIIRRQKDGWVYVQI